MRGRPSRVAFVVSEADPTSKGGEVSKGTNQSSSLQHHRQSSEFSVSAVIIRRWLFAFFSSAKLRALSLIRRDDQSIDLTERREERCLSTTSRGTSSTPVSEPSG